VHLGTWEFVTVSAGTNSLISEQFAHQTIWATYARENVTVGCPRDSVEYTILKVK
jgi:hypothetical protein